MIRVIRDIACKDLTPDDHFISFAGGLPAPSILPVSIMQEISQQILEQSGTEILQYGEYSGYAPLRESLKKFINRKFLTAKEDDEILLTYGSTEALYILANCFINPGDKIIVEDPTYINAINVFDLHDAQIIGVPMEDDGVNIEALEEAMKQGAKFFYTIPTFSNPTSITMSREKRKKVYELAVKYNVPILEDNPYGELRFEGEAIEPIKSYDTCGAVAYLGTASKVFSPGIRVGYIACNKELFLRMTTLKNMMSGGSENWSQYAFDKVLKEVDMDKHIAGIAEFYGKRANLMLSEMKKHFHPSVKIIKPEGGMFIWANLPDGICSDDFCMEAAEKLHIAIVPGGGFSINHPDDCTGMRFNYTLPTEEEIVEGIKIIGELTYKYCE